MDKKVLLIAALIFALIFVVLMAVLMGTVTNKTNAANTKLVDTLDMTEGMELSNYDGATVKGNSVINIINNGKSLGGKTKLWIYVETLRNNDVNTSAENQYKLYGYGNYKSESGNSLFKGLYDNDDYFSDLTHTKGSDIVVYTSDNYVPYSAPLSTDKYYISESAEFRTVLVRNTNDVVVGIHIVQVS